MSDLKPTSGGLKPAPIGVPQPGAPIKGLAPAPINGKTPTKPSAKPKAAKEAADPLGAILNFGGGVINAINMGGTFVEGYLKKAIDQSKDVAAGKQPLDFGKMIQNDVAAGAENATAWTRGQKTNYGADILKSIGVPKEFSNVKIPMPSINTQAGAIDLPILGKVTTPSVEFKPTDINLAGLALDIATDPTNLIPGKVLTTPAKALTVGAKTAIKAGKLAGIEGKVSEKIIAKEGKAIAEGATPQTIKPGAQPLEQYTKKPLVKQENIRAAGPMAEAYKNVEQKVTNKLTYKTVESPLKATASEILGSAIEAGSKAAKTVVLGEIAQHTLTGMAKAERKLAKVAESAAPKIVVDGTTKDIQPFEPHVTPDKTYVYDSNIMHTFDTPAEATSWVKAQTNAPKSINVTQGGKPIVDTGAASLQNDIIAKLPTTSKEAKTAQKALTLVDKIVKSTKGVSGDAEKTYGDFNALVDGLKRGDQVDYNALENIVKAFDPQAPIIKQLDKANKSPEAYAQLKGILVEKGPQTVYQTQERINLIDSASLLKAKGIAYSDVAAGYTEGRLNGSLPADTVALTEGRIAAQERIANYRNNPDTAKMLDDALNNLNRGLSATAEKANELLDSPDALVNITNNGELALRNTEKAYQSNTKAMLLRQYNQSGEAATVGSVFAIMRKRTKATQLDPQEFIHKMSMVNDANLAILGARSIYAKPAKAGAAHFVYLSMEDFARTFMDTGAEDTLKKALFPDTSFAGVKETDSLSTISLGQAMRSVLEHKERNLPIDMEQLVKDILKTVDQKAWSTGFKKKAPAIAKEVAAHLTKPEVITILERTHASRALAAVEDALASSETLSLDLFNTFLEGWRANLGKGVDTVAARDQLVRDLFNKFVYTSGIFKNLNGDVAQSVFQSAAMVFLNGGKLRDLAGAKNFTDLIGSPIAADVASRQVYADAMESINSFFKQQPADTYAAAGRELAPFPSEAAKSKATSALTEAKLAYETHIIAGQSLASKSEITAWEKKFNQLQVKLDAARTEAWKNSVPTHHWQNGQWVPSATYSREAALREAKAAAKQFTTTPEGVIDRTIGLADTAVSFPTHQKMTAAESQAWLKNWRKENNIASVTAAEGTRQEAAKRISDDMPVLEASDMTPGEQAQWMLDSETAQAMDELQIKVISEPTTYRKWTASAEKFNGTSSRWNVKPLLARAESTLMNTVSNIADYAHTLRGTYISAWRKEARTAGLNKEAAIAMRQENFTKAFNYAIARAGEDAMAGESALVRSLVQDLRSMFDTLFGNPETSAIVKNGIDPKMLASAFKKYGLSDKIGFVAPTNLNPSQLADYLAWLPFAQMPKDLGEIEKAAWAERSKVFKESGQDPFILVTRMAQAIQFARTEKGIVADFANQFGYKQHGLTFEQAIKEGWVAIKGQSMGGTNLSDHLPRPEDGGLFPPHIAKEFASLNREWNKLYNSGGAPKFLQTAMDIQGFFKAFQTILRPGHHFTNAFGDTTTAMIAGTRNPIHWKQGLDIALQFAGEDVRANWSKNKLEGKFLQMFKSYEGYGRAFNGTDKTGKLVPAVTIYKDGKAVKVNLSTDDLLRHFQDRGIVVGNIFQNDIQGLYDSVLATDIIGERKSLIKAAGAKLHQATSALEKPAGSFASYYSNIPRAAHAMQVIQSRSWSSIEEAMNAASQAVMTYHPTIQSLAASERRGPRLAISYYTWLRVAHNAFIDMALNHTSAMLIPSRIQYNEAEAAGMQPESLGNPWSRQLQQTTPGYVNYSVYAPTAPGTPDQGPILYKRSILPMDVLDTWNFSYDPSATLTQNAFENIGKAGRVIGKSINIAAQPIIEWATGTNLGTGQKSSVKDLASFGDSVLSNMGLSQVLKGLTNYTPQNKLKNPPTPAERELGLKNWLFGQKGQIIINPANIKNKQLEVTNRINRAVKNKQGQ